MFVRFSTASQLSALGRVCAARKNAEGTSSTDNELADSSGTRTQVPDQNDAKATSTATLPAAVGGSDRGTTASDTTVAATVEVSPGPPSTTWSSPRDHRTPDSVGHLPLSASTITRSLSLWLAFISVNILVRLPAKSRSSS